MDGLLPGWPGGLVAEAMAAYDGLKLAVDFQTQCVHLEIDCQKLVKLWEQRKEQRSRISPWLQQIESLSRSLLDFKFSFVSRLCNNVAHECAHLVTRLSPVEEWQNNVPPAACRCLDADCNFALMAK